MARAPYRSDRADRGLGWLIAVSSLALGVWWVPDALAQRDLFPWWWNLGAWLTVASFLTMVGLGRWLPIGVLRALWLATPALLIALQLLSFGVLAGDPAEIMPWVRLLEPASVCLLVLVLPPAAAVAGSIVSSLSVSLSAWIFTGGLPQIVVSSAPVRLSNVVFVALVIGVRRRLTRPYEAEAAARAAEDDRIQAAAEAAEQARLSRFIHDEVLSVLSAARFFDGAPPAELRAEAATTLRALAAGRFTGQLGLRRIDPTVAVGQLRTRLTRLAPRATIVLVADGVAVEAEPVEALGDAAAEAVRNATRHAHATQLAVDGKILGHLIEISVVDNGVGFDPARVPPERLGVRESIIARVAEVGGQAQILTTPGQGTTVRLTWTP